MGSHVRYGPLWYLSGLAWLAGRTRMADPFAEEVRRAATGGPCVFVLPDASLADYLSLRAALAARGLPVPGFAPGAFDRWFGPVSGWFRRYGEPPEPADTVGRAVAALQRGEAVCLFADDARIWWREDSFRLVLEHLGTVPDVRVVPVTVVWDRSPDVAAPLRSFFLGKRGVPSWFRRAWLTLAGQRPFLQVGVPMALSEVRDRVGAERLAGVLKRMVARALLLETRTVRGPVLLPWRQLRRLVLESPPMREFAREEARRSGQSVERVERRMSQEYGRIAANFSWTIIQLLHVLLKPLWTRVFRGVDATARDVERIRSAMRDGTAVLVPSHKSHFDYVLLSWFLYDQGMIVPHVAAGMNLAIWPLSLVLRGAGGFFLRRSFKGDALFPKVFERYLRELVLREYPIEFFPEGGRTRSGKLLPPRLGLVGMVLDAAEFRAHGREVTFLPIAFMYEQVAEEAAYARELGGQPKRAETLGELFRARSVLGRRYGRVFLRVGTPIPAGPLVDATPEAPALSGRTDPERRALVRRVGAQILHRIGQQTVALPSSVVSLALLSLPRRGVRHAELLDRTDRLLTLLRDEGCPLSPAFAAGPHGAIAQVLDRFVRDGHLEPLGTPEDRVWQIDPEHRITLDFYKNQLLHWLAPAGLAACALRTLPDGPLVPEQVAPPFERLRALWRREFNWDPDAAPAAFLASGLDQLRRYGAIGPDLQVVDVGRIGEVYGLFRSLLEGYRAVLAAGPYLPDERLAESIRADHGARLKVTWLSRPESLSLVTLQNAVAVLVEDGALDPATGAKSTALDPGGLLGPMVD